jgi:hypothetical protein
MTELLIDLLMMTPPLCVVAWILVVRYSPPTMAGLVVEEYGETVRLRPTWRRSVGACLVVLGVTPFLALAGSTLSVARGQAPWSVRYIWACTIALTAAAGLVSRWRVIRGQHDIVLDGPCQMIRFRKRKTSYDQIERVEVRRKEEGDSESDVPSVTYSVWVVPKDRAEGWELRWGLDRRLREEARLLARFVAWHIGVPAWGEDETEMLPYEAQLDGG